MKKTSYLVLILVLIFCCRKNKKQPQVEKPPVVELDEAERENLINYKIEGGQEKDEENFNIGVMKKPVGPIVQTVNTTMSSGANQQQQQELDCNDQNMIFAYEGEGSDVGSLSSVGSNCDEKDIDLEYLGQWGPKFVKLASIYTRADDPNADYQNQGYEYNDDYRGPR